MFVRMIGCGVAALTLAIAAPALALDTGQCLPAQQVRDTLKAEGQNTIIIGNRTGYGYPTALIFTSNTDGSRGYLLRGDKPLGQQADTICVDSVYRDIRVNDVTRPGIPAWAKMGEDPKRAEAICKRDRLGYQEQCLSNGESLSNLATHGIRVMLAATGSAINPRDKSVRDEQRLIVLVSPSDYKGTVKAVTPEGASYMLSAYTSVSYTQHGEAILNGD